jgi:hypothetical protein
VTSTNVSELKNLGFTGVVLMGAIWMESKKEERIKFVKRVLHA